MNFNEYFERELARKEYSPATADAYRHWTQQIAEFFPYIPLEELSEDQIKEYLSFLINRKRLSPASVRQAKHALNWLCNEFFQKNYDILSFQVPRGLRKIPGILYPSEVLALLTAVTDTKMHLILATIYSAGLNASEATNLKVSDVDFKHKRLQIKRAYVRGFRTAILSEYLSEKLQKYIAEYRLTKWLFVGSTKETHISTDVIYRAFRRALRDAHIDKKATLRNLRYSYVKHLEWQGIPLRNILKYLDMGTDKLLFYAEIEPTDVPVTHSPLDRIMLSSGEGKVDTSALGKMLLRVKDDDEKDYLFEAIKCIDYGAYRAGVIFAWTAAIQSIRRRCMNHSLTTVNTFIKKHHPKAVDVQSLDDFAYIKDSVILQVGEDLGEFDKSEKAALRECLDLRNRCGHPSKYNPHPYKVTSFLEELITIVFSKA